MPSAADLRIAQRVREAREYLELSVDELAAMLEIEVQQYAEIEAGDRPVTAGMLAEISRCLGRSLDYFTGSVTPAAAEERTAFLARAAETLSDRDMGELQRFATFLRTRSKSAAA